MKMAYGVPVPRGVPKDWEVTSMVASSGGDMLRRKGVPELWGDPVKCVAWFDRFGRCRACVGHYTNGRAVLQRADANGAWNLTFSDIPRDSDAMLGTKPEGLSPEGVAARAEGIAQTLGAKVMTKEATPPLPDGLVEELRRLFADRRLLRDPEADLKWFIKNFGDRILTALTPDAELIARHITELRKEARGRREVAAGMMNEDGERAQLSEADRLERLADRLEALTQSSGACGAMREREEIISAWAFAHDIDGAARNDLFKRLRQALQSAPAPGDEVERHEALDDPMTHWLNQEPFPCSYDNERQYDVAHLAWVKRKPAALKEQQP